MNGIGTEIASHDVHHIWIRGLDLTEEIMGKLSFGEVVFLLLAGRLPVPEEGRLVDAMLVALMEHGLTASAVVARTTYAVAPESLQGAVAAGMLGAGSVVLGSMEDCGRVLTRVDEAVRAGDSRDDAVRKIVEEYRAQRRRLPGIGHAIHTEGDPRADRLYAIAEECGRRGAHLDALALLASVAQEASGKRLPINVTGAVSAILLELGVRWELHRGFALISRSAGLVAHIGEELEAPIVPALRKVIRTGGSCSRVDGADG